MLNIGHRRNEARSFQFQLGNVPLDVMVSLLELPQCIWRDKIIEFFKKVEDLVRLDSAVCNRKEREHFLTVISGCKQFGDGYFLNETGKIRWFALREIIVMTALMGRKLSTVDEPYVPQVLSHAKNSVVAYR